MALIDRMLMLHGHENAAITGVRYRLTRAENLEALAILEGMSLSELRLMAKREISGGNTVGMEDL